MNTQPTRAPQEHPTPTTWKTKWYRLRYRFLRRIARLLRMPRPLDMNQALKNQRWEGFQEARDHYLGNCPVHPEERLQKTDHGFFRCFLCFDEDYFKQFDSGPITDPRQGTHMMPATRYTNMRERGAGPHTAAQATVPNKRLITRSLQPPKEG